MMEICAKYATPLLFRGRLTIVPIATSLPFMTLELQRIEEMAGNSNE
jgi:hypothetical protein